MTHLILEMKAIKGILLLAFVLGITTVSNAQEDAKVGKVWQYLEVNGTMTQYSDAYLELLNLMEKQYPKSDRNSNGWLFLERNKTKALSEIRDLLTPIYLQHFSDSELDQMYTFFNSDTGQQLVQDKNQVTEAQKKETDVFFASKIGSKIKTKQGELTKEIVAVSEMWSRDLYETATLLLKE